MSSMTTILRECIRQSLFKWLNRLLWLLGLYDLIISQFVPESLQKEFPNAYALAGKVPAFIPLLAYPIVFLLLLSGGLAQLALAYRNTLHEISGGDGDDVPTQVLAEMLKFAQTERLGAPIAGRIAHSGFSLSEHENAAILWSGTENVMVFLPSDDRPAITVPDLYPEGDQAYFDDRIMRERTATPENKLPPLGGVGRLWEKEKQSWQWIGYRKRYVIFGRAQVFTQRFTEGRVMGPLPAPHTDTSSRFYVIRNDGSYVPFTSDRVPPPKCERVHGQVTAGQSTTSSN
jgi:hypothetical protein